MGAQVVLANSAANWVPEGYAPYLFAVLLLSGIATVALFGLGIAAYYRRRSTPYLLVALALSALVARTVIGLGTAVGVVPMVTHHLVEQGLDFGIAVLLLYTVYRRDPV